MADIFFSYSTADRDRVAPLVDVLVAQGWSVWWDRNLFAGPSFEETIETELDAARCIVVAWSLNSVQSRWCRAEANEGLERGILVPLRLDDVRAPLPFRASQTASLVDWPDAQGELESLLAGVRGLLQERNTGLPSETAGGIRVGGWRLLAEDMAVTDGETVVRLTPLSWNVLMHMVLNRDRLIETQELLNHFWRGDVSDASAVRKAVHEIRHAFADDPKSPQYIKTVPKKGYMLLADVDAGESVAGHAIAVLPFLALSDDPKDEYLSDGISEEILTELGHRLSIPVIARSTCFQFRDTHQDTRYVGQRIGATHVVEGSVRRIDNHVRVTAQLVATDSGLMLWSGRYDRTLSDLLRLQQEVSREVVGSIQSQLGYHPLTRPNQNRIQSTTEKAALDCYLRGNALLRSGNPLSLQESIELFRKAVSLDPGYLSAWLGLAHAYVQQAEEALYVATLSDVARSAEEAVQKVLAIDPENGRAMGFKAWIMIFNRYQFEEGLTLFELARANAPNDAWVISHYAYLLNCLGDARAVEMFAHAYRLDPLDASLIFMYAVFRLFRGEQTEAVRLVESLISEEQHSYVAHLQVGLLNAFVGRFQVARHHLNRAREIVGADFPGIKVLEYYVELNKDITNPELLNRHLDEIERISRRHPTPLLVTMGWPEHQIELIWQRAIAARQATVIMYACMPKPTQMSDEFWQEVQSTVGVQGYLQRVSEYLRPAVDRAMLVASQRTLSAAELADYVGNYDSGDGLPLTVERRGQELWITFPDTGDYHQLISTDEEDRFEFYGFFRHLAFTREDGGVAGFTDVSEHARTEYRKVVV